MMIEVEYETKPRVKKVERGRVTKRSTVTIPHITESNSSIELRQKNRKIVESLEKDRKRLFTF